MRDEWPDDRWQWLIRFLLVLVALEVCVFTLAAECPPCPCATPTPEPPAASATLPRPGVLVQAGRISAEQRQLLETHPLLDSVVLSAVWAQVEPARGQYDFRALIADVDRWTAAGKGVVVVLGLYGADEGDRLTPAWIYQQPRVRALTWRARHGTVRIPIVWDVGFAAMHVEPLVAALARALDGRAVTIMPGFGHIGNMNSIASPEGSRAALSKGWTPQAWMAYCRDVVSIYRRQLPGRPLLIKASGRLLKNPKAGDYELAAQALLEEFARSGVSTILFGLEPVPRWNTFQLAVLAGIADTGVMRLGLGDDWPLWRDGRTTVASFELTLANIPPIASIVYVHTPELIVTHPQSRRYLPEAARLLGDARARLLGGWLKGGKKP